LKALNIIKSDFYFSLQTNSGKANLLGAAEILFGGYDQLFSIIDRYSAVKREDIPAVAKKYFHENNKTGGRLIPEGGVQ